MQLLCLDGNSILNRAFYGIKLLSTKDGRYTNAIQGFLNILIKLREQQKPDAVAIAFDLPGKTFRHEQYLEYKATRKGMPAELAEQMPVLQQLLRDLGYTLVTAKGFEADDILGAFAHSTKAGDTCKIATGDRDSLQLVGEDVRVLLTTTQFGKGETREMGVDEIFADYGVAPRQLIEVKALMGDSSDNVPGVAGVGEKTALMLIQKFGSLEGVYANIEDPAIKPGAREKLLRDRDNAFLSRQLVTICDTVPVETKWNAYVPGEGDPAAAAALLGELEMHTLIGRLGLKDIAPAPKFDDAPQCPEIEIELPGPGWLDGRAALYLLADESGYYASAGAEGWRLDAATLRDVLQSDVQKFCFDSKRLFHAALDCGVSAKNIVFDLKLAAYLLNPAANGYALGALAAEYRTQPLFGCGDIPLGLLEPLCKKLAAQLDAQGMRTLHDEIELPLATVLAEMEHEGFLLDVEGVREFGRELSAEIEREQQAVYGAVGYAFNLNSPKQLGKALFEDLQLPVGRKTKSGYSTDAETLDALRGAHPAVDHILRYRTYQKLNSTYVEGLLKAVDTSGRVHTEFNQTETRTGRISSREPNLQNIPVRTELGSRFRKYFIAAEGNTLLDADYSQIELRVLASIGGDARMIAAFQSGRDIHTETAAEIFRVPPESVTPELRRRAKAVNFGIVYGIGAFSLAQDVGVSVKEAGSYIEGYLATYSGVAAYLENTVKQAERDGFVTTVYGRRRALPELQSTNKQIQALGKRLAMNTPIQGTAADIIKIAMVRVARRLRAEALDARLVLQVHDELIIESTKADAKRAAVLLQEEMESAARLAVPLEVDVGEGATWYGAKA